MYFHAIYNRHGITPENRRKSELHRFEEEELRDLFVSRYRREMIGDYYDLIDSQYYTAGYQDGADCRKPKIECLFGLQHAHGGAAVFRFDTKKQLKEWLSVTHCEALTEEEYQADWSRKNPHSIHRRPTMGRVQGVTKTEHKASDYIKEQLTNKG